MSKIIVAYWTQTGNTLAMAEAIGRGITEAGKEIALFGSYGWGDGQWMRDWEERMTGAGASLIGGEGVICQEAPDGEAIEACVSLGKQMAEV